MDETPNDDEITEEILVADALKLKSVYSKADENYQVSSVHISQLKFEG